MCGWHVMAGIFLFVYYRPPTFEHKHEADHKTKKQLLMELDYFGLLIFVLGCTFFLVGINFGGRQYPWGSPQVIACLVAGIVLLTGLGFWECFANLKYPLFPPKLFRNFRGYELFHSTLVIRLTNIKCRFVVNIGVSFLCGMMYYSMQVIWPQMSQLLFVPADDIILRGVYANLTGWSTWGKSQPHQL